MLRVQNLSVRHGAHTLLDGVSFTVGQGEWLMLSGPNGAGKTTLIRALSRTIPYEGLVSVGGEVTAGMKTAEFARRVAVLDQSHAVGYAFTVEEVVRLGRYAYGGAFGSGDAQGDSRIEEALRHPGLASLRRRRVTTLSGGEIQRVFLAQCLAQNPRLLLLDEPTSHLDLPHQKELFALLGDWLKTPGRAVVSVVHDLSLARAFGTGAALLGGGKLIACGAVRDVFSDANLASVYGMDVRGWMRGLLERW